MSRAHPELLTPAELAIRDAAREIEKLRVTAHTKRAAFQLEQAMRQVRIHLDEEAATDAPISK
ncbi:hypothetical protein [Pleomorphomonas oryzae]|uniref:hypothetical protein n=1 Tax=Pleomorphomonas oryzae TaxID=261934 RepID=UPI0004014F97|nr:hypothetical protein [Pleomorphomonas oryzae]